MDSSAPALALAKSNAQLNGWQQSQYHFLKDDVVKYMQQQIVEGKQWDLVVLDPPKLAPNRKSLNRALAKYRKLNTLVCISSLMSVSSQLRDCTRMLSHCSCHTILRAQPPRDLGRLGLLSATLAA